MPYISRNGQGEITELHDSAIGNGGQWMDADNPEVLAFLKRLDRSDQVKNILNSTDHDMLRVVEDLVDLLMEKKMFTYTELPEVVQQKLNTRKQLRKDLNMLGGLINDDDTIF